MDGTLLFWGEGGGGCLGLFLFCCFLNLLFPLSLEVNSLCLGGSKNSKLRSPLCPSAGGGPRKLCGFCDEDDLAEFGKK